MLSSTKSRAATFTVPYIKREKNFWEDSHHKAATLNKAPPSEKKETREILEKCHKEKSRRKNNTNRVPNATDCNSRTKVPLKCHTTKQLFKWFTCFVECHVDVDTHHSYLDDVFVSDNALTQAFIEVNNFIFLEGMCTG